MKVSNVGWNKSGDEDVWYMLPDGSIKNVAIADLEYPYIYSNYNFNQNEHPDVVSNEKCNIRTLFLDGIYNIDCYKTSFENPSAIKQLKSKAALTVEGDIRYLERRLGADGVIEWTHPQNWASVDIEVNKNNKIFLIGAMLPDGRYYDFDNTKDFSDWLKEKKVGLITGWNSYTYDYPFLEKEKLNPYYYNVMKLDSMVLYNNILQKHRRPLAVIAEEEEVGEKLVMKDIRNMDDWKTYNERDCNLVRLITLKHGLTNINYEISALTGVEPHLYMMSFLTEGYIMKNRQEFGVYLADKQGFNEKKPYEGAIVVSNARGVYEGVADYDFSSLYPGVILNLKWDGVGTAVLQTIQKAVAIFVNKKDEYDKLHRETKEEKYKSMRYAYKILANGSYGLFGSSFWRYYAPEIAAAVTAGARQKVTELGNIIKKWGYTVIYQDTDSAFVIMPKNEGEILEARINDYMYPYKVKLEDYYNRIFFRANADKSIRKRYAGYTDAGKKIVKGFELIRGDWTPLAKTVQAEIFDEIYFAPVDEIFKRIVVIKNKYKDKLKRRQVDIMDLLITKTVKDREYANDIEHVRAFKMMKVENVAPINFVTYWWLKGGEILPYVENHTDLTDMVNRIDWDKYYEKQVEIPTERLLESLTVRLDDFID